MELLTQIPVLFLIVFLIVVILVLLFVVIKQQRRIKQLLTPRYGFLGKPLAFLMLGFLSIGAVNLINTVNQKEFTNVQTASADFVVDINILSTQVSEDIYRLSATPIIDGIEWGSKRDSFDINWTIQNGRLEKYIERDVSQVSPGGIEVRLRKGLNRVTATIFMDGQKFEKTIEIDVEI
ncbi:hypothetical protein D6810_00790 [Candidatus Dojkabacteria bacterium]|uniref:Uncharacterized protein n=1 Tax=Candidatus Dojkabacteria bacterium TaxID=2099670 RepID=A0A3M0YZ85_9BACT|nr:MAG: hypothetical protein D6810_00790 [Candidatus Dojkabacteria bacterium]